MNRTPFALLIGLVSIALAACGGGGGGSVPAAPTPKSSSTAPAYAIRIHLDGGTTLATTQIVTRNGRRATLTHTRVLDTNGSSQLPVEMAVSPSPGSQLGSDSAASGGVAVITVSPEPSSTPSATASVSGLPATVVPTTAPNFILQGEATTPTAGALTAVLSGSVNASATVPLYQIGETLLACGNASVEGSDNQVHSADQIGALTFSNGIATPQASSSGTDAYIDGPNCTVVGTQNNTETEATLHFPYGATLESSSLNPFATISATLWTNSFTSITFSDLVSGATAVSDPQDELLIQTASGAIVKLAPLSMLNEGSESLVVVDIAFAQDGYAVDDF